MQRMRSSEGRPRRPASRFTRSRAALLAAVSAPLLPVLAGPARAQSPMLTPQQSGTTALLQAVSAVDDVVVWVSGHEATFARTTDGGRTWHAGRGPGPDSLQFRDVHAVDAETAYLLSAGPGAMSRIYKTTDAGESWTLQFLNGDPNAFFDCLDFWDAGRGVAFSDAVDGEFVIIRTDDGGESWTRVPPERVPDAAPTGEGGFAASGTCLVTGPDGRAWIGTGVGPTARVLRTDDYGRTWRAFDTPIVAGDVAGIFSLVFFDARSGVALGGDLSRAEAVLDSTVAVTDDGGETWTLAGRLPFAGAVYGAAGVAGAADAPGDPSSRRSADAAGSANSSDPAASTVIAVGPGGLAYSHDAGRSWARADTLSYWAVGVAGGVPGPAGAEAGSGASVRSDGAAPAAVGWAVGPGGRIVRIEWPER